MQTTSRDSKRAWSVVMALSTLLPFGVHSAPQPNSGYIGAKAGWVSASHACGALATDCDNDTAGGGLFGGYVLNDWLAFELGLSYLGEINAAYPALGNPTQTADYKGKVKGIEFVAKPYWQINDNWSVFGKGGTLFWDMDVDGSEVNFTHTTSDSDWSPLLGTGVEYAFNRNWSTTLEYQWIDNVGGSDTGGMDLNVVNLGVIYHFATAPAPEPVAAEPPPVPVVEKQENWTLKGPSFAYNSSTLLPEIEQALQPALERLKQHPQAHMNIETHTDSMGSEQYNQQLSDQRAKAVLAYFINNGVPTSQLTATGMGETHPIADNNTEDGRYQNRRIELFSPAFSVDSADSEGQQ